MLRVTCLGGAGTVTGSNYLVETSSGRKFLVDCGLFQGGRRIEERNTLDWSFNPASVDTLFLTHAHIDHSGRIPKLVKDGFAGRVITSPPTAELCQIMLLDSAHIQEMDAEWQTRKNRRRGAGTILPLYTTDDAEASLKLFEPVERDRLIEVEPGIKARLRNAGHILGSSILEIWVAEDGVDTKIVFSGDLGKKDQLILKDRQEIFDADYLFLESTYGNRRHRNFEDSRAELLEAIRYSSERGEKTIIPAFAVERTQEILYVLADFYRNGELPEIPIYLDSPLAIRATEIFRRNKRYYDEETRDMVRQGVDPFDMPNLHFTLTARESQTINEARGAAIVISANGMCTAGRIKHHLKHNLWRAGASLVIVGFQAQGTTGRKIIEGAKQVKIFGENVAVKARVFTIGGFSAHADQSDLLDWVSHFESKPRVFLVHGEPAGSEALALAIQEQLGLTTHIPRWREKVVLKPREFAYEEAPEEPAVDVPALMLNGIIDVENQLKLMRKQLKEDAVAQRLTENDIERLKYVQEELQSLLA